MDLLDECLAEWQRLRADRAVWSDVDFVSAGSGGDRNGVARARVLWAAQCGTEVGDLPLLRHLFEQEARACRESSHGTNEELHLSGLLVAEYRRVEDVWRHWAAKTANYDTYCGYDRELILAAGFDATIDLIRNSDRDERRKLLEYLEPAPMAEDEIAECLSWKRSQMYPADPAELDDLDWVERFRRIDDLKTARVYVDRWASEIDLQDRNALSMHAHLLAELGDFAQAAHVRIQIMPLLDKSWDLAGQWRTVAELHRRAGDPDAALLALRTCTQFLPDIPNWRNVGLGRSILREYELLAEAAPALAAQIRSATALLTA